MKSYAMSRLLLLLFLCGWSSVHGLCKLDQPTVANCDDLEDAKYIDTYHLHLLRTPSAAKTLAPGYFKNLTSLEHLDLSKGNIDTIETGSFAKLVSLRFLNLANNHIAHLEAGAFDGLKHLRTLKLSGNKIKQLPSALMTLKELRYLDVSDNPLNCNCASMKLRDVLLSRGVIISKKTRCVEPISSKGLLLLKPDTKTTCLFEAQDLEMQGDQPVEDKVEGSGDVEEDKVLDDGDNSKEVEVEQPVDKVEEETPAPTTEAEGSTTTTTTPATLTTLAEVTPTEEVSSSPAESKDDTTSENTEDPSKKDLTTEASSDDPSKKDLTTEASSDDPSKKDLTTEAPSDDLSKKDLTTEAPSDDPSKKDLTTEAPSDDPSKKDLTTEAPPDDNEEVDLDAGEVEKKENVPPPSPDILEGSGETDDDGSGGADDEGSGILGPSTTISPVNVPGINFNDTFENELENEDSSSVASTTSGTPTTKDAGWWGVWEAVNPFGPSDTTTTTLAPSTTEKNPEEQVQEEEFMPASTEPPKEVVDEIIARKALDDVGQPPAPGDNPPDAELAVGPADSAPSQEVQKGNGSYYVLATLLAILAILIAFAAYKGDFCKKKRKRGDVERGTEMKDMQKSLLEQNAAQPKVQASNGNTMENVPLMNSTTTPEEPKENQRSYDITPAKNGSNKPVGLTIDDPVKPPRKGYEIEAPLNGLNPPMDDIDGPTTLQNGSDDGLSNGEVAQLSPGAQRVKITMGELPESVPKTPILITRLKNGDNLVKAP